MAKKSALKAGENIRKIYIGPSLKGIARGTVFQNGLTPELKERIQKTPASAELVVPVGRLRDANRELADSDSALSRFFQIVEKYKEGE